MRAWWTLLCASTADENGRLLNDTAWRGLSSMLWPRNFDEEKPHSEEKRNHSENTTGQASRIHHIIPTFLHTCVHGSAWKLGGGGSVSPELPPTEASTTTFGSNCDEYPQEESDDSQCIHQLPFAVPIIAEYRVPQYRVFYSNVQQHATALDTFAVHTFNPRSSQQPLYSYLDITEEYRVLQ